MANVSAKAAAAIDVPDSLSKVEIDNILNGDGSSSSSDSEGEQKNNCVNGNCHPPSMRVKHKAKRAFKMIPKDIGRTKSESNIVAPLRALKNSRKSRSLYGRGLPKKGGAGGKGTWGALGCELMAEEDVTLDPQDPNYDEESMARDVSFKAVDSESPIESIEDIEKKICVLVQEYFEHGDTDEVCVSLSEMHLGRRHDLVVWSIIQVAMDHKPSHREMASVLLADLYGATLSEKNYMAAFDRLLNNLSDLVLDTPDAATVLGNFVARSIADDCIPPKFLQNHKGKMSCEQAVKALSRAEGLLSMRHGLVRLDNVWGVGGGTRPVKHLIKKMVMLLMEYLSAADIEEATRCLQELEVPHFHHELVYEAVNIVLERMDERTSHMIADLLKTLCEAIIITPNQMNEGFLRIYDDMPQICLDVPMSYSILEKFVNHCHSLKIVDNVIVKRLPSRGRKRFVSEGDGGRVKDHAYFK